MYPNTKDSPVPEKLIAKHQIVFDLVYNPIQTKLIKLARRKRAKTISGIDMFVAQGVHQIELWTKKKIATPGLIKSLKKKIT
jgi:shikimate 5-dehydrogenase